jgi:hypothetical protein
VWKNELINTTLFYPLIYLVTMYLVFTDHTITKSIPPQIQFRRLSLKIGVIHKEGRNNYNENKFNTFN